MGKTLPQEDPSFWQTWHAQSPLRLRVQSSKEMNFKQIKYNQLSWYWAVTIKVLLGATSVSNQKNSKVVSLTARGFGIDYIWLVPSRLSLCLSLVARGVWREDAWGRVRDYIILPWCNITHVHWLVWLLNYHSKCCYDSEINEEVWKISGIGTDFKEAPLGRLWEVVAYERW